METHFLGVLRPFLQLLTLNFGVETQNGGVETHFCRLCTTGGDQQEKLGPLLLDCQKRKSWFLDSTGVVAWPFFVGEVILSD